MRDDLSVKIVNNSKREIVDIGHCLYVYIPLTTQEATWAGLEHKANPAWRIRVPKDCDVRIPSKSQRRRMAVQSANLR